MTLKPSMIHTDIKKVIMPSYILVKFYVIRLIKIQLPFVWVEGDEFVIFAKLKSDEEALALKKQIEYNVRQFNIKSKEPFHFSFSLGIAKFNGKNTDAFLSAMDDSMYETKNMHRLMQ